MSRPPVVVPLRGGKRPDPDHLRWVLRSVDAHLPHDGVVIVGGRPPWINPETVTHVATTQGNRKFVNIGINVHAAIDWARANGVDHFYWFNDDMYLLEDVDEIPLIDRGPVGEFCLGLRKRKAAGGSHSTEYNDYLRGMEGQRQILRQWGFDDETPCTDLHVPIPIDVARLAEVLEKTAATNPEHPHGHFRMLYGAGLPSVRLDRDVKPSSTNKRIDHWPNPYFSTSIKTWIRGTAGMQIRDRFPHPSPYERKE